MRLWSCIIILSCQTRVRLLVNVRGMFLLRWGGGAVHRIGWPDGDRVGRQNDPSPEEVHRLTCKRIPTRIFSAGIPAPCTQVYSKNTILDTVPFVWWSAVIFDDTPIFWGQNSYHCLPHIMYVYKEWNVLAKKKNIRLITRCHEIVMMSGHPFSWKTSRSVEEKKKERQLLFPYMSHRNDK